MQMCWTGRDVVRGPSRRLAGSYVLAMLAVVVLVEAFVVGYQAPGLVNDANLQALLGATGVDTGSFCGPA